MHDENLISEYINIYIIMNKKQIFSPPENIFHVETDSI